MKVTFIISHISTNTERNSFIEVANEDDVELKHDAPPQRQQHNWPWARKGYTILINRSKLRMNGQIICSALAWLDLSVVWNLRNTKMHVRLDIGTPTKKGTHLLRNSEKTVYHGHDWKFSDEGPVETHNEGFDSPDGDELKQNGVFRATVETTEFPVHFFRESAKLWLKKFWSIYSIFRWLLRTIGHISEVMESAKLFLSKMLEVDWRA